MVNFIYSLAVSKQKGGPIGTKVDSRILSEALKKAGLRKLLPSRTSRHVQADAVEALIIYAWGQNQLTIKEGTNILAAYDDPIKAFCVLILNITKKMKISK